MKNLILTSILVFISLISFSQTKIVFSNSSITLYTSSDNKGIDEILSDPSTTYSSSSDSYGLYNIDLIKKTLTLTYNGFDEIFFIKENKIVNDVLYLTTLTMDKDIKSEAKYRINLKPNSSNDDFAHQKFYNGFEVTYGIISQIKILSVQ